MADGIYAFLVLAIFVWFALGMASPSLSLPPILMRVLEPGVEKPSRKIVVQWSCIFTVALFITVIVSDFFKSESTAQVPQVQRTVRSTEIHAVKMEIMMLVDAVETGSESNSVKCTSEIRDMIPGIKTVVKQISLVEQLNAQGEPGAAAALADIRSRVRDFHSRLESAGCLQ